MSALATIPPMPADQHLGVASERAEETRTIPLKLGIASVSIRGLGRARRTKRHNKRAANLRQRRARTGLTSDAFIGGMKELAEFY
jgi:hypothetical protein